MFPARAGMSLAGIGGGLVLLDVPRASGDEPGNLGADAELKTCSPRERG